MSRQCAANGWDAATPVRLRHVRNDGNGSMLKVGRTALSITPQGVE
jgi:hypothetical protein